jgi:hypothetical protein
MMGKKSALQTKTSEFKSKLETKIYLICNTRTGNQTHDHSDEGSKDYCLYFSVKYPKFSARRMKALLIMYWKIDVSTSMSFICFLLSVEF